MHVRGILIALLTAAAAAGSAEDPAPVTGQYMEDRSNRVYGCLCEWSLETVHTGREPVLAWNILSGEWDGQALAGVRIAAVIKGVYSLSEDWAPRRSTVFVDSSAPEARQRAGLAWLRSRYGELLGQVLGVHTRTIDFGFEAEGVTLRIGDALEVRMRRASVKDDALGWAVPLYEPFIRLISSTLATTERDRFAGPDLKMLWDRDEPAITGYYGVFARR